MAVALVKGKTPGRVRLPSTTAPPDVPSQLLDPVVVTVDNIKDTVVKDGFYTSTTSAPRSTPTRARRPASSNPVNHPTATRAGRTARVGRDDASGGRIGRDRDDRPAPADRRRNGPPPGQGNLQALRRRAGPDRRRPRSRSRRGRRPGGRQRRGQVDPRQGDRRGPSRPTSGTIEWEGERSRIRKPTTPRHLGIATVYQDLALCDNLDVVANLFLGREEEPITVLDEIEMERRSATCSTSWP